MLMVTFKHRIIPLLPFTLGDLNISSSAQEPREENLTMGINIYTSYDFTSTY